MATRRAKTTARGYGKLHQRIRKALEPSVARGEQVCSKCGLTILPGQEFDLDHSADRRSYLGPAHRYARDCPAGGNRNTSGRKRIVGVLKTSRSW